MTSENKRRKSKRSHVENWGEKIKEGRRKRIFYFNKATRNKLKNDLRKEI